MVKSIHLENFPNISQKPDYELIANMNAVKNICSNALSIRKDQNIKVRIPLAKLEVFGKKIGFLEKYKDLIASEVNVKLIEISDKIDLVGTEKIDINFKTLGPKVGSDLPKIIKAQKAGEYEKLLSGNLKIAGFEVEKSDFKLTFALSEGIIGRFCENEECVVILDTNITEDLKKEGIARDLIRLIQQDRKDRDFNVADRIKVMINCDDSEILSAINCHKSYISSQCLADGILLNMQDESGMKNFEIAEKLIKILLLKDV